MAKKAIQQLDEAMESLEASAVSLPEPNLSLGSDIMDIHVSGTPGKAVSPGMFLWFHGNSGSGKSFHAKLLMAEAANNSAYDQHRLVIFDGENGSNFDCEEFFGRKMADRIEAMEVPSLDHLYDALDALASEPFIGIVDSWDSWLPHAAIKKLDDDIKKRSQDKEIDGSYGMEHGKIHSNRLRQTIPKLVKSNSILIGVSQHRDNVNKANPYSPKDVVPGGRALKFWCHLELEMAIAGQIKKTIRDKEIPIGEEIQVTVRKNRVNGLRLNFREHFYPTYGIDNVGSTIAWLKDNKYLVPAGGRFTTDFTGDKGYFLEAFIEKILQENQETALQKLLISAYTDYMTHLDISLSRKKRY